MFVHDMMGGIFGYEPPQAGGEAPLPLAEGAHCARVSSGRAALEVLLANLPHRPERVWLPRFCCDTVLPAFERQKLPLHRYACDAQLRPLLPCGLGPRDAVVLINYFGLTGAAVAEAAAKLAGPVLVDASTALYAPLPEYADGAFYSFRKFLPVADGGAALARFPLRSLPAETDDSTARMEALYLRARAGAVAAQAAAQAAEDSLAAPPRLLSAQTQAMLRGVRAGRAAARRCENYRILHSALAPLNRIELPDIPPSAPMCYPFVSGIPGLRDSLIDAGIALPLYWPEVIAATSAHETENALARTLLPLPLDQRYGRADMERLLKLILGT